MSSLLRQTEGRGALCGIRILVHSLRISHLLFTDNTILFIHDKPNVVCELLSVLRLYEAASGQKVNLAKVKHVFQFSISRERCRELSQLLGTFKCLTSDRYLGFWWLLG